MRGTGTRASNKSLEPDAKGNVRPSLLSKGDRAIEGGWSEKPKEKT